MPYFRSNEGEPQAQGYTQAFPREPGPQEDWEEEEPLYDDGFDDWEEEPEEEEEELTEEEIAARNRGRAKMLFSAGNLAGVLVGVVLILALVALLISMIHFVSNDFARNFSLFRTNF